MRWLLVLLAIQLGHSLKQNDPHNGFKLLEIYPQSDDHIRIVRELDTHVGDIDFLTRIKRDATLVPALISPEQLRRTLRHLRANDIDFKVKDVPVSNETLHARQKRYTNNLLLGSSSAYNLNEYISYDEQVDFLRTLASEHPNLVSLSTLGRSFEGRDIYYVTIGYLTSSNKPVLFIDAGIHAREWIAPAVALKLIKEFATNPQYTSLLNQIDIIIAPNINPDGYEYSRTTSRMWRKNTKSYGRCAGVDLNRNFPFMFGYSGVSSDPCSEIYKGPSAESESETVALANILRNLKSRIKAYLTLHSYGQNWVYPWGYAMKKYPPDVEDLKTLANEATAAIYAVRGTQYLVSSSSDGMYAASGASDDFAKSLGIKYVYTVELSPYETSQTITFDLPASEIAPVSSEILQGVLVVAKKVANTN